MDKIQTRRETFTKTEEREIYITSDGREFDNIHHAEIYQREIDFSRSYFNAEAEFNTFTSEKQLVDYIEENFYSDTSLSFNPSQLEYPIRCCLQEEIESPYELNGEDDIWIREATTLHIFTVEQYKEMILKQIENLD